MKKRLFIVLIALSMVATLSFGAATTVNAQAGQVLEAKSQSGRRQIRSCLDQGDRHEISNNFRLSFGIACYSIYNTNAAKAGGTRPSVKQEDQKIN